MIRQDFATPFKRVRYAYEEVTGQHTKMLAREWSANRSLSPEIATKRQEKNSEVLEIKL